MRPGAAWLRFRWLRARGVLPWWWERDRRKDPGWDHHCDVALADYKREGMF
jgi:hypothetical protein